VADTFLQERIAATKALIVVYEDALTALVTNGTQRYVLDTGQSRQDVTKIDVPKLNAQLDGLYNRLATQEARLDGRGVVTVRPAW
jgi:hypothetical protein